MVECRHALLASLLGFSENQMGSPVLRLQERHAENLFVQQKRYVGEIVEIVAMQRFQLRSLIVLICGCKTRRRDLKRVKAAKAERSKA